jgi:leucyl-tRNA synthetase
MNRYDHKEIEQKWQKIWEKEKAFEASDTSVQPKFFALIEFPFASGQGMHNGHLRSNTAMDIISRKRRAEGYNVLYPIGWDAFGLPTENYAIKTGKQPSVITRENTDTFRKQLKSAGFSFDWSREINTSDPAYYKWTQWIFLQFFKQNLAYKKKMAINWCPKDKIGLANEEVVDGRCERCGTPVEKREKEQWMLAITKYADRLDKDLDTVDYLEKIKIQQRNWIGRSEGAEFAFKVSVGGKATGQTIKVFTTRADTLFGVTYIVLAPEHPLVMNLLNGAGDTIEKSPLKNTKEVADYVAKSRNKDEITRTDAKKEKTGVELKGITAINPANGETVPVWVADYALVGYGTGAVMAVPAHDERDFAFAKKYNLPIKDVVMPVRIDKENPPRAGKINVDAYVGDGTLTNSGDFDGKNSGEARREITKAYGEAKITYKLKDWIFSRQRYWGEPIPLVYCEHCAKNGNGWTAVPEKDLPVTLPKVDNYQPTDTGESPLSSITKWVNTTCPVCDGPAKRETDTMPNWAGSSWYYLRYADPKNKKVFASEELLKKWTPVDWYNGGMEHTTLHLLYSRFWHKFLFDLGLVPTSEPYAKRTSHGLILAADGEKMSKSRGNVVSPDEFIKTYGADALRLYEMFMGPFDQAVSWNNDGIVGTYRFLERIWRLQEKLSAENSAVKIDSKVETLLHQTIVKVSSDIENMHFNTAISALMILTNELEKQSVISVEWFKILVQLISPFAPHIAEELWTMLKNEGFVHQASWPKADDSKMKRKQSIIIVQVNGKVRSAFETNIDISEKEAKDMAISDVKVKKYVDGKKVMRVIFVPNKLINIVVGD